MVNRKTSGTALPAASFLGSNHQSYIATRQGWSTSLLPLDLTTSTSVTLPVGSTATFRTTCGVARSVRSTIPASRIFGRRVFTCLPARTVTRPSRKSALPRTEKASTSESLWGAESAPVPGTGAGGEGGCGGRIDCGAIATAGSTGATGGAVWPSRTSGTVHSLAVVATRLSSASTGSRATVGGAGAGWGGGAYNGVDGTSTIGDMPTGSR